jgi:hypothetical protein
LKLTLRQQLTAFAHVLQSELFPRLVEHVGALTAEHQRFTSILAMLPLQRFVPASSSWNGRPQRDRQAIAAAFVAKAVLGLSTTRQLLNRLQTDDALRKLCGWDLAHHVPHEATFSRAFAQFAQMELAQFTHEALIAETLKDRLVGHIARDSSAIEAHERFPETPSQKRARRHEKKPKHERRSTKGRKYSRKPHNSQRAPDPDTLIERQKKMPVEKMLGTISQDCSIGVKMTSKRVSKYWTGYKIHVDVADGQIPVTALLSGANVHDSQLSVPLATITSKRVTYLYELMDSAYDAQSIREYSAELGHVAIIDRKSPQNQRSQLAARRKEKLHFSPAQAVRFRERTMVERVFSRLKNEFGGSAIRVRGPQKVMQHLMFGILALTADQLLRLAR